MDGRTDKLPWLPEYGAGVHNQKLKRDWLRRLARSVGDEAFEGGGDEDADDAEDEEAKKKTTNKVEENKAGVGDDASPDAGGGGVDAAADGKSDAKSETAADVAAVTDAFTAAAASDPPPAEQSTSSSAAAAVAAAPSTASTPTRAKKSTSKKDEELEDEELEPLSQLGPLGGWSENQRRRMAASFIYAVLIRDNDACLAMVTSGGLNHIHAGLRRFAISSIRVEEGDEIKKAVLEGAKKNAAAAAAAAAAEGREEVGIGVDLSDGCTRMFLQKSLGAVSMCQDPRVSVAISGNNPEGLFSDAIVMFGALAQEILDFFRSEVAIRAEGGKKIIKAMGDVDEEEVIMKLMVGGGREEGLE